MKHFCLSALGCCLLFVAGTARAQSFTGYNAATYAGVYGAFINPANILNHRVKADINLAGFAFSEANNIVKLRLKAGDNAPTIAAPTGKTGSMQLQGDVLGPSFLVRLSDKHALAVATRARMQFNADKLSAPLLNLGLLKDVSSLNKTRITAPGGALHAHAWTELAFTYSRQVAISSAGVWKAAASIKLMSGQGAAFFKANESRLFIMILCVAILHCRNRTAALPMLPAVSTWRMPVLWTGGAMITHSGFFAGPTLAADLGISYEYRDEMQVYGTSL